jgi:hypothetical protein
MRDHGNNNRAFTRPVQSQRQHGLGSSNQVSFPATRVNQAPSSLPMEGLRETQSECDAVPAPQQGSKPRFKRYTSMFSTFRETKGVEFSEPWNEDDDMFFQPYIDPVMALQSTRSFVHHNPTTPIPCTHNSGLLKLFEDYRQVKYHQERLESKLENALRKDQDNQDCWNNERAELKTEIRRLELIVARGQSDMAEYVVSDGLLLRTKRVSLVEVEQETEAKSKRGMLTLQGRNTGDRQTS